MGSPSLELVRRTTCPHCWKLFAPEDLLWISGHADLRGDPRLGPEQPQRFLPTRFTPDGAAIDSKGFACTSLACPHCHLGIPRPLLEMEPFFISIFGTPSCGKSYYLAALTWSLRQSVAAEFALSFADADPSANLILSDYERALFLSADGDRAVPLANLIRKTELQGELYDAVQFGNQTVSYPRPFMFTLKPLPHHPNFPAGNRAARVLCVYDNAGEHCLPGQDAASTPATHHLARSRVLLFLFDPTQDPRFRNRCQTEKKLTFEGVTSRQESVLAEAAARVRRFTGMSQAKKHDRPLIVTATKFDVWRHLLPDADEREPWQKSSQIAGLDLDRIQSRSHMVRDLLRSTCPELIAAAEDFANEVLYLPVSAIGSAPSADPVTSRPAIRPRDIRPSWVAVPLLVGLRKGLPGLLSRLKSRLAATHQDGAVPAGILEKSPRSTL